MNGIELASCSWLIDLDGTLYRGKEVLRGAVTFIEKLRSRKQSLIYLTNNSSRTPEDVAAHLLGMGIPAEPEDVCTSAQIAADYVSRQGTVASRVFMIGENGLEQALINSGCQLVDREADYVVLGIDRSFSYHKLQRAAQLIREGATFILSNPDLALPSDEGLYPGAGSLAAAVHAATGVEPLVMGKPSTIAVDYALRRLKRESHETVVLGDNLLTDIATAHASNMKSVLVLTGYSTKEDALRTDKPPTLIIEDLTMLCD